MQLIRHRHDDTVDSRPLTDPPDPDTYSEAPVVVDDRSELPTTTIDTRTTQTPVIVERPAVDADVDQVRTVHTGQIVPAAIVGGMVAIALLIFGGITAARAGLSSPLAAPVVEVAGYTATGWLAVIELGLGAALLIVALARLVSAIRFLAIVGLVASVVAVFEPTLADNRMALERDFALGTAIAMGVLLLASFLPTTHRRSSRIERS